jgi:hypothetical protein
MKKIEKIDREIFFERLRFGIKFYRDEINSILKWIATILTILGALAISHKIDPLNIYLLNAGSVFWIIWSLRIREYSILLVNVVMMLIYAHGLIIRLV